MSTKYTTKIEITSEAANKDEAMEIVGEYLSGNIASGIDMRCTTKPVRFHNQTSVKVLAMVLLIGIVFLSGTKMTPQQHVSVNTCQMAAVQPPLKTSSAIKDVTKFKKEWDDKQMRAALDIIKK